MNERKRSLENIFYILKLVMKANPAHIFIMVGISMFARVFNVFFFIYLIKYIYTSIENRLPFRNVAIMITVACLGHVTLHLISAWNQFYYKYKSEPKIFGHIYGLVIEKAVDVDLKKYDEPDFYNSYTRALDETTTRTVEIIKTISDLLGLIAAAVATLIIILAIDPYVLIFAIIPLFNMIYIHKKTNKLYYNMDMENTYHNRRANYVKRVLYEAKYAKEIKLTDIKNVLMKNHSDSYESMQSTIKKYYKKIILFNFIDDFIMRIIVFLGSVLYVTYKIVILGLIALGDYLALINAISSFSYDIFGIVNSIMAFNKQGLYIENLRKFLDYETEDKVVTNNKIEFNGFESLEVENVSFGYEGSMQNVIKNVSFKINKGERIAIVGRNGAGKTTLIKLITRLYKVTTGSIKLNGIDIYEYGKEDYKGLFSTVFQDFKLFALTVEENVLMDKAQNDEHREAVLNSLKQTDAYEFVSKLEKGIDTSVTKEFDDTGIIFSGGQQQKIALSRVYAKNSDVIILDEPSSALDPIAERDMYDRMLKAAEGKTVILISHRLASAQGADKIFVIDNGEIIEWGNHFSLMKAKGKYYDMYSKQAQNYN